MRADLPQPMSVESLDRPARMSNSLMPAASQLQNEIGTLPVVPATNVQFLPVQRKRQKQNPVERRATTDECEAEPEDHEEAEQEEGRALDVHEESDSDGPGDGPDAAARVSVRS